MKNKIQYIITISLAVLVLASGKVTGQQINLGAKVGSNFNSFSQPGMSVGFNIGGYASYKVTPYLIGKFEPQYSQVGGGLADSYTYYGENLGPINQINQTNRNVKFQTLELPLLGEFFLPEFADEKIVPKLIVGASYAKLLKGVETYRESFQQSDYTVPTVDAGYQSKTVTSDYYSNQFSAIVGLGLNFKAAKRDFQFDFRYRQGLTQVSNDRYKTATESNSTTPYTVEPGGSLYTSSFSINFSMHIYKFQF